MSVSIEHQVVPEMDPDLLSSDVAFYLEDLVAEPSPGEKVNEFFDPDQELMDIGATAMSEVELVPVFGEGGRVIGLRPDVSDVDGELALIVARSEARTHSATAPRVLSGPTAFTFRV